jgi:transcriptional antiterminator RfaH
MSYWAVAQTEPRREATAARYLGNVGFETYLPHIAEHERIVPLFATYVFVKIIDHWVAIRSTIGVVRVLLAGDRPAAIPEGVLMEIRARENRKGLVQLPKPYRIGDQVKIVRGSFRDHLAIYDGMTNRQRERVLLALLGRLVKLELEPGDITAV